MIKKVSSDAVVSCWSSTRITRDVALSAFGKVGKAEHIPNPDRYDALREACAEVCRTVGLTRGVGSLKYESLRGGKSSLEVIRKIKGAAQNDWPFLFSAIVESNGEDFVVRILQTSEDAGVVHEDKATAEEALNDVFQKFLGTVSARDLTEAMVKTVRSFYGTAMKPGGGSYFFPETYAADYVTLQSELDPHGPNLVLYGVDLKANPQAARHMAEQITEEVASSLESLRQKHSAVISNGGKTRSTGNKKRFDKLAELMQKVKAYREILQLPIGDLEAAIKETKRELGLEAFRSGVV